MGEQGLSNIPRLEEVREILRYQDKHFDGSGAPNGTSGGEAIPWGGRALKLVLDLDQLESEGARFSEACDTMRGGRNDLCAGRAQPKRAPVRGPGTGSDSRPGGKAEALRSGSARRGLDTRDCRGYAARRGAAALRQHAGITSARQSHDSRET